MSGKFRDPNKGRTLDDEALDSAQHWKHGSEDDEALASAQHWKGRAPGQGGAGSEREVGQFQGEGQPPRMKK